VFASLPKPTVDQALAWSRAAQLGYAGAGITTAQEGATHKADLGLMRGAAARGANIIDIVALPFITDLDSVLVTHPASTWGTYENRLKLGGVKITTDGSPQARTRTSRPRT
jgi:predicted amidohydrolase YtcJ